MDCLSLAVQVKMGYLSKIYAVAQTEEMGLLQKLLAKLSWLVCMQKVRQDDHNGPSGIQKQQD